MDQRIWALHLPPAPPVDGPLAGQRLAVKDLFDIAGYPTGAGNPDWRASHALPDHTANCVTALCEAGAVLVGKTQTDELAYSLNGANVHYGTPVNPAAPDRLPGGSSSGSAVAVASNAADIGLGTDTGGSIRVPASYCGLYGFRPSWGAISLSGAVPLAPRFDTAGVLTRTPQLLAAVGDVLLPPSSVASPEGVVWLAPEGITVDEQTVNDQCELMEWSVQHRQVLSKAWLEEASSAFRVLQGRAIWQTHGDWVTRVQPRFASDIAARLTWSASLTEDDEQSAAAAARRVVDALVKWSDDGRYALALPSSPGAAPRLDLPAEAMTRYRETLMGMTALAGLWGAAVLAAPWLTDQNAPWGVSVIAAPGQDRPLLAAARRLA